MRATHESRHGPTTQTTSHNTPLSAFFAEVVRDMGSTPPRTMTSPLPTAASPPRTAPHRHQTGGFRHKRRDTPATRRQDASNGAKPPPVPPASCSLTGPMLPHRYRTARPGPVGRRSGVADGDPATRAGRTGADKRPKGVADNDESHYRQPAPRRRLSPMGSCTPSVIINPF